MVLIFIVGESMAYQYPIAYQPDPVSPYGQPVQWPRYASRQPYQVPFPGRPAQAWVPARPYQHPVPANGANPQRPEGDERGRDLSRAKKSGSSTAGIESEQRVISDSKKAFIDLLTPIVRAENRRILLVREEVQGLAGHVRQGGRLSQVQSDRVKTLVRSYRVKAEGMGSSARLESLLEHIDIIPASLALAQAAGESGWGTSRFTREANNLFGIWTYDEEKGLLPKNREKGKKHFIRKFDGLADSVRYYMHMLNSHPAYSDLRELRKKQRRSSGPVQGYELAKGLLKYSAKGEQYIALIQTIIQQNAFAKLDVSPPRA